MNGYTLLAYRLLGAAYVYGVVLLLLSRTELELGGLTRQISPWVVGVLCVLSLGASGAGVLEDSHLSKYSFGAIALSVFGCVLAVYQAS
jgi:hypothetical protein